MILPIFVAIPMMAGFVSFLNHIKVESVQIQDFTLVIIFDIFLKNDDLDFKMKILKFLGIQPRVGRSRLESRILGWSGSVLRSSEDSFGIDPSTC